MRDRLAAAHIDVFLAALHRSCAHTIAQLQAETSVLDNVGPGDTISNAEVVMLLRRVEGRRTDSIRPSSAIALTSSERHAQEELRALAQREGIELPIDRLARVAGLDTIDVMSIVVAAAPEFDRAYGAIYAYLADDADRRVATVDTVLCLLDGLTDRHELRREVGPFGTVRRLGLLGASAIGGVDRRAELSLRAGLLDYLLGADIDPSLLVDTETSTSSVATGNADVPTTSPFPLAQLAVAFDAGLVDTVYLRAESMPAADEAAIAFSAFSGRTLTHVRPQRLRTTNTDGELTQSTRFDSEELRIQAITAACAGSIAWVRLDDVGDYEQVGGNEALRLLIQFLATTKSPVLITGTDDWRGSSSVRMRSFVEVRVQSTNTSARRALLHRELPHLCDTDIDAIARQWNLTASELHAAIGQARTTTALEQATNECEVLHDDSALSLQPVVRACASVSAVSSGRLVTAVMPRRGRDLLVLPTSIARQIDEITAFTRAANLVVEDWGFGRLLTGGAGVKALFVGDPGTGKTLAAEVLAHSLGVQLLKVDLAQLVSKWVGETAKHLDSVFREAAAGNSVLFFDEADALFGKRGEVRHGTDRYANTEVSHLLQRFEQHRGLVILASNLRQNIDPAFARRFDAIVEFPRPEHAERRRLWQIAFPAAAPVSDNVDVDALSSLDMTGAGIVGAARLGALLAADRGAEKIEMADVVGGVMRQYQTDGRILTSADLGRYAHILDRLTEASQ